MVYTVDIVDIVYIIHSVHSIHSVHKVHITGKQKNVPHCKLWVILAFLKSSGREPVHLCTSHPEPYDPKNSNALNPQPDALNPKTMETNQR